MSIRSDKGYVSGQPRIEGHRIWVSLVVFGVNADGLERYIDGYDVTKQEVKDALEYCRKEQCAGTAVDYCQDCNKSTDLPGEDVWKIAEKLYNQYFDEKK